VEPPLPEGPVAEAPGEGEELGDVGDDVPLNTLIPDTLATPQTPGPEAVKQHVLTHLPYQSWCRFCVEGRGRDDRHRRQNTLSEQQLTTPRIEADFMVLDDIGLALSIVDSSTSFGTCVYLPQGKQSRDPYAVRCFGSFLRMHPAPALILQVDSEPALVAMARLACASVTTKQIKLRTTVRASKGILGSAERYHSTVAGLARSLLARVRAAFVVGSEANELLGPWALRHASWLSNRFQPRRPSDRSSFELPWAHAWKGSLLPFGEVGLVRRDVDRLPSKFDARWQRGLYVGHDDNSNAHVVLTCYGVQLSRSIRRLPAEPQRDKVVFEEASGLPWDMLADGRVEAHMKRKEKERQAGEQEGRPVGEPAREPGGGEGPGQASVPELIPMVLPESVAVPDPPAVPTLGPQRLTPPSEPTPACSALRWGARWRAAAAATAAAVVQLLQVAQLRRSGLQQIHQELASGLLRPLGGRARRKGVWLQAGKLGSQPA